eukprot:GHRR01032275.1.p1 GENE.GHRR01032275.1~~GHRR01032275.1.p1  ORF type:complete len:160 (-),score=42.77 GHRR01032275.1:109-588(-)
MHGQAGLKPMHRLLLAYKVVCCSTAPGFVLPVANTNNPHLAMAGQQQTRLRSMQSDTAVNRLAEHATRPAAAASQPHAGSIVAECHLRCVGLNCPNVSKARREAAATNDRLIKLKKARFTICRKRACRTKVAKACISGTYKRRRLLHQPMTAAGQCHPL